MKILVTKKSGETEILNIHAPLTFWGSNNFQDGTGTDFFFNEDGTYDGWGRSVSSNAEAEALLDRAFQTPTPPVDKIQ